MHSEKSELPEKEPEWVTPVDEAIDEAMDDESSSACEKSETELLKEQHASLQDQHLRLMAEYDNFRKRSQREKDDIYQNATATVLAKILPVQDNFERAKGFDPAGDEFVKGLEMIEKGLADVLTSFGVESFGEVGEPFDPNLHHAVMHIEDESFGENAVSQVLQKGYKMGDRVLRYAMVQTAN